mmetsp:Transcript_70942/g.148415  ORF Transcript_70942/g.148415 Transcript_70942/m.148415 type:complete len:514 (-) Transcript_70942:220-1761(-)
MIASRAQAATQESEDRAKLISAAEQAEGSSQVDVAAMVTFLARQSAAGAAALRSGRFEEGTEKLRMAAKVCSLHENTHPALAVESARSKLNLGVALAMQQLPSEALEHILAAKESLASVIGWADECSGDGDAGVAALAAEARTLSNAALEAEGEAQQLRRRLQENNNNKGRVVSLPTLTPSAVQSPHGANHQGQLSSPSGTTPSKRHQSIVAAKAAELANRMEAANAVTEWASLREERASLPSPTRSAQALVGVGIGASAASASASLPSAATAALAGSSGAGGSGGVGSGAGGNLVLSGSGSASLSAALKSGNLASSNGVPGGLGSSLQMQGTNSQGSLPGAGLGNSVQRGKRRDMRKDIIKKDKEKKDIFKEFIKDVEVEKELSRAGNETWQEDARKRLEQVHRSTKLMLELTNDVELKEKRYTYNGHKVMMQSLLADNRSRSDPSLVKEARRAGISPEVHQVRKYNKALFIKPKTPPQVPKEPPKPKVDPSIALALGRPKPQPTPAAPAPA